MTETFVEMPAEPASNRSQLLAAIILGIAATLTAISAYQASLSDGTALEGYSTSTRTLSDANAFYAEANQVAAADQQLFVSYATARYQEDADLADYFTTLMRPELVEAIEWFDETGDEVNTPFDDVEGNPYTLEQADTAVQLEEQATAEFDKAATADARGDQFQLATVLFALTLFFGGVATLFNRKFVTRGLLFVSVGTLLIGGVLLLAAF